MTDSQARGVTAARALAAAVPLELSTAVVWDCARATLGANVDHSRLRVAEQAFAHAFGGSIQQVPPMDRGGLNAAAGNIAEAVIEVLLADFGWHDSPSSGGHGVDLLMLTPDLEKLVAIEVKATLQAHRWPRLANYKLGQLSPVWLDKSGNIGMTQVGLASGDVYGMVVFVQFTRRQWKAAVSHNLADYRPIINTKQLLDLSLMFDDVA